MQDLQDSLTRTAARMAVNTLSDKHRIQKERILKNGFEPGWELVDVLGWFKCKFGLNIFGISFVCGGAPSLCTQ